MTHESDEVKKLLRILARAHLRVVRGEVPEARVVAVVKRIGGERSEEYAVGPGGLRMPERDLLDIDAKYDSETDPPKGAA